MACLHDEVSDSNINSFLSISEDKTGDIICLVLRDMSHSCCFLHLHVSNILKLAQGLSHATLDDHQALRVATKASDAMQRQGISDPWLDLPSIQCRKAGENFY